MLVMELKYGGKSFALHLPDQHLTGVIRAELRQPDSSPEELIAAALDRCAGEFRRIAPHDRVVIITSDITRYTGSELYLPLLVERLHLAGVRDEQVTVVIALGIHRPQSEAEHRRILGPLYGRIRVIDHDCDDQRKLVTLGTTSNGIKVEINRTVAEAEQVILTGTIGFHYFAGFGGGRKSVLPGVASRNSCMASHFAVLNPGPGTGKNPLATAGNLQGNPVHLAMEEACAMLSPLFSLNTVLGPDRRIIGVFAGEWRPAHTAGCRFYGEQFSFPIDTRADLVVVSCGGYPKDINLIQAHKSMEYGCRALREGGVMILLAECRDGYGNATFFNWFSCRDLVTFEARLRSSYEINGQTAYSLLAKAQRFRIILVSKLPPEEVRQMQLLPATCLDEALELAKGLLHEEYTAHIIPDGGAVLPVYNG